jgi:hypothetical protein
MYRTDPLKDDGTIDLDFFASCEFPIEQESLIRYLNLEGFSEKKEEFVIDYRSRRWYIKPFKKGKPK